MILGATGGGVAVLALMIGLFIWGLSRGANAKTDNSPVARGDDPVVRPVADDRPKETPRPEPPKDPKPSTQPIADVPKDPKPAADPVLPADSALSVEVLRRVKAATLYVKVDQGGGRGGTGSGFFEQSTGLVLTNAHVVGMLREGASPPRKVEVVLNSGADGETFLPAELVSVDRDADLALLRVQLSSAQSEAIPRLTVAHAKDLLETQPVYVAGFPFGEKVNRGVTISSTSVSSLHRGADGALTKVQVNGGMHPGNSGGPVIDGHGKVIGVAVSGIPGTQINFAIPGEKVESFIEGRVAEVHVTTDVISRDGKLIVPVQVMAIDPRKRITKVALDYWTGPDRPTPIPPSDRPPT
jgi:S1-C subfamily serine protease